MSPVELIALSLALSIAVAAIAGLAAAGLERATTDPALRDRAWAWALYLPVLPPLAVAATLLTPAPVRPIPILPTSIQTIQAVDTLPVTAAPVTPAVTLDLGQLALAGLILAALLVACRLASLVLGAWRLNRLIARAHPASPETRRIVAECAAGLSIASPTVRAGPAVGDALLAGLTRPVLVLPQALAETPDSPAARAVITHELAHLKRGDHRAVWIEESIVALLAVNPILPLIRTRRAAAREEACDALALTGADPAARRVYATSLIDALRARTAPTTLPALTFNGTPRSQAMRRLKSILTPPASAGWGTRTLALGLGLGLLGLVGLTTAAVASQRAVEISWVDEGGSRDDGGPQTEVGTAAQQATAAAMQSLSPEQRARYRNPSVADYRRICESTDEGDGGFCAGVIFSQMKSNAVCAPATVDDPDPNVAGPALGVLVERTEAQFDTMPASDRQTPAQFAHAALQRAYPCEAVRAELASGSVAMEADGLTQLGAEAQASLPEPQPGLARLWLGLDAEAVRPVEGDTLVVSLRGEAGERYLVKTSTHAITPAGVPDTVVLDLEADYFPVIGAANRSYVLQARVERAGQTLYAATPATVRLAAGSQAALSAMRPELRLVPAGR